MIQLTAPERALALEAIRSINRPDTLAQLFDEPDRATVSGALAKICVILEGVGAIEELFGGDI